MIVFILHFYLNITASKLGQNSHQISFQEKLKAAKIEFSAKPQILVSKLFGLWWRGGGNRKTSCLPDLLWFCFFESYFQGVKSAKKVFFFFSNFLLSVNFFADVSEIFFPESKSSKGGKYMCQILCYLDVLSAENNH